MLLAEEIIAAQAGTVMGLVNECLRSEGFSTSVEESFGEGEVDLGEGTPFEKALVTVHERIVRENNAMVEEVLSQGGEPDRNTVDQSRANCEILSSLWEASVRKRLRGKMDQYYGVGLRKDFRIAGIPRKETGKDHALHSERSLLAHIFGGVLLGGIIEYLRQDMEETRDGCSSCEDCGECQSSKETRKKENLH